MTPSSHAQEYLLKAAREKAKRYKKRILQIDEGKSTDNFSTTNVFDEVRTRACLCVCVCVCLCVCVRV
jgi:hypothetical protein